MKAVDILNDLATNLSDKGYNSYALLDTLKEENKLDDVILKSDFLPLMKDAVNVYLDYLFSDNDPHYLKKIKLEKQYNFGLMGNASYILSLFLDNGLSYRVLPLLIKSLIDKFGDEKYKKIDYKTLKRYIYSLYDIRNYYNPNIDKFVEDQVAKYKEIFTNYSDYDQYYSREKVDTKDQTKFFVWSEHFTYENEAMALRNYPDLSKNVLWVARYYGDGYGYDVLSINPYTKREKLIEVKSGSENNITLTRVEFKVMNESSKYNADYYIYKYFYDKKLKKVMWKVLKFNRDLFKFIDVGTKEFYSISPNRYYNGKEEVIEADIIKDESKKLIYG